MNAARKLCWRVHTDSNDFKRSICSFWHFYFQFWKFVSWAFNKHFLKLILGTVWRLRAHPKRRPRSAQRTREKGRALAFLWSTWSVPTKRTLSPPWHEGWVPKRWRKPTRRNANAVTMSQNVYSRSASFSCLMYRYGILTSNQKVQGRLRRHHRNSSFTWPLATLGFLTELTARNLPLSVWPPKPIFHLVVLVAAVSAVAARPLFLEHFWSRVETSWSWT